MVRLEEFSTVVSQLYASAANPLGWDAAMAGLTRLLDATACTVALGTGPDRSILSTTICEEAVTAYVDHYHQFDFVMQSCESGPVGSLGGGVFDEHRHSEYFTDWQQRFDMTDGLFVRLSATEPSSFIVSAPTRSEPYGTGERVRLAQALIPHLQQSLSIRRSLLASSGHSLDVDAAPEVIRHALFVIAGEGHILHMNAAARRLALAADGLLVLSDRLQAASTGVDQQLRDRVGRALVRRDTTLRTGGYVVCPRPSGKRPFVVRVTPLDGAHDPHTARAAIIVIDPEHQPSPPRALLQQMFRLTRAESEVALRMLNGHGLQGIADELTVSVGTVKTHVQRLFRKTGTHRQGELIRLLSTITA